MGEGASELKLAILECGPPPWECVWLATAFLESSNRQATTDTKLPTNELGRHEEEGDPPRWTAEPDCEDGYERLRRLVMLTVVLGWLFEELAEPEEPVADEQGWVRTEDRAGQRLFGSRTLAHAA